MVQQRNLTSLSLTTDSLSCRQRFHSLSAGRCNPWQVDLKQFPVLRALTWIGIEDEPHVEALRDYLFLYGQNIQTLHLNVGSSRVAIDGVSQPFWWQFYRSLFDQPKVILPQLNSLSLSGVFFPPHANLVRLPFDISKLRSLRISKCPWASALIEALLDAGQPLRLKALELNFPRGFSGYFRGISCRNVVPICALLNAFDGLEALALAEDRSADWPNIMHAISGHSSTLKRLVTHEGRSEDYPWGVTLQNDASEQLFRTLDLDFVGCSHQSKSLVGLQRLAMSQADSNMQIEDWRRITQAEHGPKSPMYCRIFHVRTTEWWRYENAASSYCRPPDGSAPQASCVRRSKHLPLIGLRH